jgi:hypothetical protein
VATLHPARWQAATALGAVAVWTVICAYEALAVSPWDVGPVYLRVATVVSSGAHGVVVAVLALWLAARATMLRPA